MRQKRPLAANRLPISSPKHFGTVLTPILTGAILPPNASPQSTDFAFHFDEELLAFFDNII
jgi:hypothetical protein